jgi:uncharacterized protein (TIGR03086 family)
MDNMVELFLLGQREFSARVAQVGDRWKAPTPDDQWDVATLVDHLIDEQRWVAPLLAGKSLSEAEDAVKAMGPTEPDRVAAWEQAAFAASESFNSAGVLDRTVELSRGPTPARDYIAEMVFDLCVHSWDLGKAIGFDGQLPDELAAPVFTLIQQYGDLTAFPGDMFKKAEPVADDAPLVDRLVAFTGRNPSWAPS